VFDLKNKTALVTGGASGIGAAIAALFSEAGAKVWIVDCDDAGGTAMAKRIGGNFLPLDVASEAECANVAQTVGTLDVLANIAGIGHVGTLLNTTAADLERLFAVNVRGVFNCCKVFVPAMLERKAGSVINMASIAGIIAVRERLAYTTTANFDQGSGAGSFLDERALQLHLSWPRRDGVCPGAIEGVSRSRKGVSRHGLNPA